MDDDNDLLWFLLFLAILAQAARQTIRDLGGWPDGFVIFLAILGGLWLLVRLIPKPHSSKLP